MWTCRLSRVDPKVIHNGFRVFPLHILSGETNIRSDTRSIPSRFLTVRIFLTKTGLTYSINSITCSQYPHHSNSRHPLSSNLPYFLETSDLIDYKKNMETYIIPTRYTPSDSLIHVSNNTHFLITVPTHRTAYSFQ